MDHPFLIDCPSLMHGIGVYYVQHFQAMSERGVCELAHFFFQMKYKKNEKKKVLAPPFSYEKYLNLKVQK